MALWYRMQLPKVIPSHARAFLCAAALIPAALLLGSCRSTESLLAREAPEFAVNPYLAHVKDDYFLVFQTAAEKPHPGIVSAWRGDRLVYRVQALITPLPHTYRLTSIRLTDSETAAADAGLVFWRQPDGSLLPLPVVKMDAPPGPDATDG